MGGLGDGNGVAAVLPRGFVAFPFQPVYRQAVQFPNKMLANRVALAESFVNVAHGGFNVADFLQLLRLRRIAVKLIFHIVRQRGVVALDPCRADTFQHMEDGF